MISLGILKVKMLIRNFSGCHLAYCHIVQVVKSVILTTENKNKKEIVYNLIKVATKENKITIFYRLDSLVQTKMIHCNSCFAYVGMSDVVEMVSFSYDSFRISHLNSSFIKEMTSLAQRCQSFILHQLMNLIN